MYKGVFGEQGKTEELLERAIATIEQKSRQRTCSDVKVGVTLEEGLLNCRNALHELRGEPLEDDPKDKDAKIVASIIASQSNVSLATFKPVEDFIEVRIPYNERLQDFGKYGLKIMEGDKCIQELRVYTGSDTGRICRVSSDGPRLVLYFPVRVKPSNAYTFHLSYHDSNYPAKWTILNIIGEDELSRIAEGILDNQRLVAINRTACKILDLIDPFNFGRTSYINATNGWFKKRFIMLDGTMSYVCKGNEWFVKRCILTELKMSWTAYSFYFYSVDVKGQEHKYKYSDSELGISDATLDDEEYRHKAINRDVEAKINFNLMKWRY